ncbi:heterokaryon incompatibility protein-domain-containing protein [Cercophora newfieldiana]|uniref:Heterokaryon incompatibility protein-domain-containing protein n=1 Tax=Cercophora newfieldiana TaxID=92897 RepID=A0AA39YI37_9PEZI|nr:heterokaryon incompatibility protein-domain-containing protein [Cercophora newfieldiana]
MRLINTATMKLEEFVNARNCPKYAILSHRWLDEEITYHEYQDGAKLQQKPESLEKIRSACKLARSRQHNYIWIDTCCIDKSSSAEISEAVNCMFAWYRAAEICFAYMSDVQPGYNVVEMLESARMDELDQTPEPTPLLHVPFHKSEWFTRGWTLQELIVPSEVEFFAYDWSRIGTRSEMAPIITKACGVDAYALTPGVDLNWVSVARKMYWASKRTTTRDEDLAYCLLGLFDVNMPLVYGEGAARAFLRLQEEIVKRSSDQSIFAWDHHWQPHDTTCRGGPFAPSPKAFEATGKSISLSRKSMRYDETIEVANTAMSLVLALEEDPFLQLGTGAVSHSDILHSTRDIKMSSTRAALDCLFGPKPGTRFILHVSVEKDARGLGCIILGSLCLSEAQKVDTSRWIPTQVSLRSFAATSGISLERPSLHPYHVSIELDSDLSFLDAFPRPIWDERTSSLLVTGRYPTRCLSLEQHPFYLGGMVLIRLKSDPRGRECLCLAFWDAHKPTENSTSLPWLDKTYEEVVFHSGCFRLQRAESRWGSKVMVSLSSCLRPGVDQQPTQILKSVEDRQMNHKADLGLQSYEAVAVEDDTYIGIHYRCKVSRSHITSQTVLPPPRPVGNGAVVPKKASGWGNRSPKGLIRGHIF